MAAPSIPRNKIGFFREAESEKVRNLLETAINSSDEQAYLSLIGYLESLFKQDRSDPVMISGVSMVRKFVWPENTNNPSSYSSVTAETFDSLSANYRKFEERKRDKNMVETPSIRPTEKG